MATHGAALPRLALVPFGRRARRVVSRLWVRFTSVGFANALIGAIAIAGASGIVVRQFRAVAFSTPEAYAAELATNRARYGEPFPQSSSGSGCTTSSRLGGFRHS